MDERTQGIVLRIHPLTESSLIVRWLTPDQGRLATVARGARRPKSPLRGKLDLFYLSEFSFSRSRRGELHTLRELTLKETHPALRRELGYLQQASYCAALLEQATEMDTPIPGLFELMKGFLDYLCTHAPAPQTVFAFELKLLNELGLRPDPARMHLSGGAREILGHLMEEDWNGMSRLKLSEAQASELRQFLHGFLIFHLGKIPKSRTGAVTTRE